MSAPLDAPLRDPARAYPAPAADASRAGPGDPADRRYIADTQAFFGSRALTWDVKFGADTPAYERAVAESGLRAGETALDVGCGTGRALRALRAAAGPTGRVIGVDLTAQMLAAASARETATAAARGTAATRGTATTRGACASAGEAYALVQADARRLPLGSATVDVIFAAGLIQHLPDPTAGLAELARVARPGARLVLFHPSGRAALAARHGSVLRPDEPLADGVLPGLMAAAGWCLTHYDDAVERFFARADRATG